MMRSKIYAILLAVKTALLALAYAKGRSDANILRDANDAKDYRNERQKIDSEVSGIGSTDADRIRVLGDIAGRRSTRKD